MMNNSNTLLSLSNHARLSPSSAHRWMSCPPSPWLEALYPPTTSFYVKEGQEAHQLAALCLTQACHTNAYLGSFMDKGHVVNEKMAKAVQVYVDRIGKAAEGHRLFVEQPIPLEPLTGEKDAIGTADAVILKTSSRGEAELQVHDLKYGRGVRVNAQDNQQLALYALGAAYAFSHLADFKYFRLAIHQPRLDHYSEWTLTLEDLQGFAQEVAQAAQATYTLQEASLSALYRAAVPGESQCRFCRAKRDCQAYAGFEGFI